MASYNFCQTLRKLNNQLYVGHRRSITVCTFNSREAMQMDMMLTIPNTLSKQSDGFLIKNPTRTTNVFTFTDESKAADELKLWRQDQLTELKAFLKSYDMTSISTDELKVVGRRLYESGVIDVNAFGIFISGDGGFDAQGRQANTHVKYNALALFDEQLEDYLAFVKSNPNVGRSQGIPEYIQGMFDANRAINALAYFVNSSREDLSVDEYA